MARTTSRCDGRLRRLIALSAAGVAALAGEAAAAPPNDPYYAQYQYGPQQVRAEQAWASSTGAGAVIAIVDSGIDLEQPDLAGKIVGGATFACDEGQKAPCGNGDWESGRKGEEGQSGNPHGTHVAGIAAAITDNGVGIAGVARDAQLLAVKALDGGGSGGFDEIAAGIRWSVDNGADVVNLSLGAPPGVQALTVTGLLSDVQDAIAYARSKNVVVVAAAGNEAAPLCDTPGFDKGALCVAATDRNEVKAWYSNLPVKADDEARIDAVSAPGGQGLISCREDIISTVPLAAGGPCTDIVGTPGYDFYAGTSMAAPHVAGVAALLMAQGRTDDNTVDVIEQTARNPVTGERGRYDPVYGYGIVDAEAATLAPGAPAPAPTTASAEPAPSSAPAESAPAESPAASEPPRENPPPQQGQSPPAPAGAPAPAPTSGSSTAPPGRVRLGLRVRGARACARRSARLVGPDAGQVRQATFVLGRQTVRRDRQRPFTAKLPARKRRAALVARAVLEDGSRLALRRPVPGCRAG